jgi:hypothetical protein
LLNTTANTSYNDSTVVSGGSYSYKVKALFSNACPSAFSNCADEILPGCLFCDDFNNGTIDPNWTYLKPVWTESGGDLIGTPPGGKKSPALATPVFTGCSLCTVNASLQSSGGLGNRIWLLAWYLDKQNKIELLMKEESDIWVLKQWVNGNVVAKAKAKSVIDPNVPYDVSVSYDGTSFHFSVGGTNLIDLVAVGTPNGTVGFQLKRTIGHFNQIVVN